MKSLSEVVRPTTLLMPGKLRDRLGLDLTLASETFQHTGSFKFRAGYNLAANVPNDEILTASSGNFGQALAYACKLLGKKCTVVMPHNSAAVKVNDVRAYGATVDLIDVTGISRSERLAQLAADAPRAYLASAYDDAYVIEGNASLGDELAEMNFDAVVVPVGGGGLVSGIISSFRRRGARTKILGAEPSLANDASRSLAAGQLIKNDLEPQTIADGARTLSLGNLNWEIIKDGIDGIIDVPDETTAEALRLHFTLANLKCEPTGALSLGAVLADPQRFAGKKVCLVVTGGNVDPAIYASLLGAQTRA
ncbi:MAG TPA: pyridoxal-phosphate dependent enzyme [Pyrinomonadaceae bacterium]|nr:pyridoxal-phosphate dependent enzyme [Pyrinomonadaceae bacterium]